MSNRAFQRFWPKNSLFPPAYPWLALIVSRNNVKIIYDNKSRDRSKVTGIGLTQTIKRDTTSKILSVGSLADFVGNPLKNTPNIWISYKDWNPFFQDKDSLIDLLRSYELNEEAVRLISDMGDSIIIDLKSNEYGIVYYGIAIYVYNDNYFMAYVIQQDQGRMANEIPQNGSWQPQNQSGFSISFGKLFQNNQTIDNKDYSKIEFFTSNGMLMPEVNGIEEVPDSDYEDMRGEEEEEIPDPDKENKTTRENSKEISEKDDNDFRYPPWLEESYIYNENTLDLIKSSYIYSMITYILRNY